MFCSTIIPTVNRPSLSRAVNSVLQQDFSNDEFEIIIVNDSGQPLIEAAWQCSSRVRIIETNQRNRSVARNAGAAIAKGKYLHFLDDDDWMMPGAFRAFWEMSLQSNAAWLYGGFRFVDNAGSLMRDVLLDESGNCLIQLMSGEWLPIQASFIRADSFFLVGGFADLPSLSGGYEDIDLSRLINYHFDVAFMPVIVASIRRGEETSTTDYINLDAQNRRSREKILNLSSSFQRLRSSASATGGDAPYWHGRIVYLYFASMMHNLFREHRIFLAGSRGLHAIITFLFAGRILFIIGFWKGIRDYYRSPSFK